RLYRNVAPDDAAAKSAPPVLGPWHLCGPFSNTGGKGYTTAYPPETEIDFGKTYTGKGGGPAGWPKADLADGQVHSLARMRVNEHTVAYLCREIDCRAAIELPVSLGSDDGLKVFLNGQLIHGENVERACQPDQAKLTLSLKPGKNRLLLKV